MIVNQTETTNSVTDMFQTVLFTNGGPNTATGLILFCTFGFLIVLWEAAGRQLTHNQELFIIYIGPVVTAFVTIYFGLNNYYVGFAMFIALCFAARSVTLKPHILRPQNPT